MKSRAANPRKRQSRRAAFPGFAFAAAAIPALAQAHGFGQRYDLPIPLSLYIGGAAITVAISCAMLIFFVRAAPAGGVAATLDLRRSALGRALVASPVLAALRIAGVALYVLVVIAGLFGNQSPLKNIAPVTIWALWWVGMAYVSALFGDVWKLVNPLDSIFMAVERLHSRWRPGKSLGPAWTLGEWAGAWPAVGLFFVFLWMEMAWEDSDHPADTASHRERTRDRIGIAPLRRRPSRARAGRPFRDRLDPSRARGGQLRRFHGDARMGRDLRYLRLDDGT
ncbi:MAG: hypothetical protein E6H76_04560 [Betaproteobacteria bacterium]|nr:MAG: hypothetical protein E6H76_04560 [Betaproteobacteria bacterium]